MNRRIIRTVLTVLALLGVAALGAWKLGENKKKMEANTAIAKQKTTIFPVTVTNAQQDAISQNFEASGIFNPVHQLQFVSEVAGRVQTLSVKEGDFVSRGQTIAQLDSEQVAIDLALANASLEKAKSDLKKLETMLEGNAITKQQVEDAKLGVKNAEARVASLDRQKRLSTVSAPISGTLNTFNLEVGSYLTPGTPVAEIVDISRLRLAVKLLDTEVMRLAKGQRVRVTADLYHGLAFEGTVSSIAAKADGARKFEVEIEVPNSAKNPLKAGMAGKSVFEFGGTKQALTLPVKCIVGGMQSPKVYVIKGDVAHLTPIVVGSVYDGKVEVISGIDTQTVVVESGQLNIAEGSKVQVIQ